MQDKIPENLFLRKRFRDIFDIVALPTIVALVGFSAFGLGRLSTLEEGRKPVVIHPAGNIEEILQPTEASSDFLQAPTSSASSASEPHNFVASKNGSKYYPSGCSSANRISPANQMWFATAAAAESAGYTRATNCK